MTDLETLRAMLDRAGVVYTEEEKSQTAGADRELVVAEGDGPHNLGYGYFKSVFGFTAAGTLTWVGAWE
jgi:hypothetical protein